LYEHNANNVPWMNVCCVFYGNLSPLQPLVEVDLRDGMW